MAETALQGGLAGKTGPSCSQTWVSGGTPLPEGQGSPGPTVQAAGSCGDCASGFREVWAQHPHKQPQQKPGHLPLPSPGAARPCHSRCWSRALAALPCLLTLPHRHCQATPPPLLQLGEQGPNADTRTHGHGAQGSRCTDGRTDTGRAGSQCRHTDAGRVGSRCTDTRTHGHRAGGVQAHRQAGGVPEAGPAGLPYLSSCFSRVRRLRAISAQASTAPCRVCRSGLCAIDSRRGKTATMGRTRRLSARRLGSEPEGRRAPLQVSGQVTGAPGLSLKPPPGQTPGPPGAGGRGAEDATHSWGSTCSPGPKPAPRGEGPDCSPRLPCRTRLAVSLPGDRAGQG